MPLFGLTMAAGLGLLACAKTEKPVEQAAAPPAPAAPNTVHVIATDFAFQVADTLPSGVTTFHMMNQGKQLHHIVLMKASLDDLKKMNLDAPPPPSLVIMGGPNAAMPGGTAEATVDLAPGTYTLVCLIPGSDGKPHMMKGMARSLTVIQGTSTAVLPTPDVTIKLTEYAFDVSAPLTAGHHVIRIESAGQQMHEMVFVKLAPGKTAADFAKWSDKMAGPPPGEPINGAAVLTTGMVNTVSVDLTAGEYALVCFVPDAKDGKSHLMHGMIKQLTVA